MSTLTQALAPYSLQLKEVIVLVHGLALFPRVCQSIHWVFISGSVQVMLYGGKERATCSVLLVTPVTVILSSLQHQLTTSTLDLLLTQSKLPAQVRWDVVCAVKGCGRGTMQLVHVCHVGGVCRSPEPYITWLQYCV